MRLRSVFPVLSAAVLCTAFAAPAGAQARPGGRTIDEGTFSVARKGSSTQVESFKIARIDNDLIQATCQLVAGDERISSSLVVDSVGTPASYVFRVKNHGATTLDVTALTAAKRMTLKSSDNRSNESMKDFPIVPGKTLILDDWLLHQL